MISENNKMTIRFKAISQNEAFARMCVVSFLAANNPTIDELGDIKTAVSEAVTNCVVHAYPNIINGEIEMSVVVNKNNVYISIADFGIGIEDIDKAREPFFTTKATTERSGMGFTVMEGFMDEVKVFSVKGKGTKIEMYKSLQNSQKLAFEV